MFAFRFVEIGPFLAEIWQITYLTLKIKVKVMAKVKPNDCIGSLKFNRYVCFSFHDNWTIFGWYIANSMFEIENSRSRSWSRSSPMITFEAQNSIDMFVFCFVAIERLLAEIWQIPYLTLKIQGQGHDENRPKCNQVIYRSGPTIVPKMKEIQSLSKVIAWTKVCGRRRCRPGAGAGANSCATATATAAGVRTGTKT